MFKPAVLWCALPAASPAVPELPGRAHHILGVCGALAERCPERTENLEVQAEGCRKDMTQDAG